MIIKKRNGNLVFGILISLIIGMILSAGLFFSLQNIIIFSNKQKLNMEEHNILLSETNLYNSMNISLINKKQYKVTANGKTYDITVNIIEKEKQYIKYTISIDNAIYTDSITIERNN